MPQPLGGAGRLGYRRQYGDQTFYGKAVQSGLRRFSGPMLPRATFEAIVACTWPPEADRENANRIAKELIRNEGTHGNWIEPEELEAAGPPPHA
jgi:hypothetical protein